ncbi:MAG: MerR family transcriptional regulator [Bacteroidota bacterium]|nr:MerR family transcriptional regulator [Bacteroidota bacterium]
MLVNLPDKRYYSIGEIAKAFNVNTSLLRFWEKEFKEIQPKKKQSGARKYTPQDVIIIEKIYYLVKEKGLTIEGTKKQLKIKNPSDSNTQIIIQKLEKLKADLLMLKEKL